MNITDIKSLLSKLGFTPINGTTGQWAKTYFAHSYTISLDFDKERIDYGDKIARGDLTTSNFKNDENFVVLECVNRLLERGYTPECITLEKVWPLGHRDKGKLDILLSRPNGHAFAMIECKTWGEEFSKAVSETLNDGGQLFSYYQQDKQAEILCLYTSRFQGSDIENEYRLIEPSPAMRQAKNAFDTFEAWNKKLESKGFLEDDVPLYQMGTRLLTYADLKDMDESDSGFIFNRFAEILRHHAVSDKPNAFNKMFTLFLCKIMDEVEGQDSPNVPLAFQWWPNDTDEDLQGRLNDLYKAGMERFLEKEIADVSESDIDRDLALIGNVAVREQLKESLKAKLHELRFYKNNEFAFKEVFDRETFIENSKVVREVVDLLAPYKIRYPYKQKFLSDFFELLLQTGLKQEAGQFFTPVPLARFMLRVLPLEAMIGDKIDRGDTDFLPYTIDYAAGSGHFLTESMDRVHGIIMQFANMPQKESVKRKLRNYLDEPYSWAVHYLFGIEKDYRLVKTAKVSCFMYGDGLANVTLGDGLAPFADYKKAKMKQTSRHNPKDNLAFDVLVANPPYSVDGFSKTIKDGETSFELFSRLTENSSEIECLFIERAKQLVRPGGFAAIILPSSILSNGGIHEEARRSIVRSFDIISIVELGPNTFMATGTNTVILFLRKKDDTQDIQLQSLIDDYVQNPRDITVNGIEKALTHYLQWAWDGLTHDDFASLYRQVPTDDLQNHSLFKAYHDAFQRLTEVVRFKNSKEFKSMDKQMQQEKLKIRFYEYVTNIERDKLRYFFHVLGRRVLLVKAGEKQVEKDFLGYEFSNRRGHEGMITYKDDEGKSATLLYDEDVLDNPNKVDTHIRTAYQNRELSIPPVLERHLGWYDLADLFDLSDNYFNCGIRLSGKKKEIKVKSRWPLFRLGDLVSIRTDTIEPQQHPNSLFMYVGLENIESGTGKVIDVTPVEGKKIKSTKYAFSKGDLLYGKLRPYLNKWHLAEFEGICSTDIIVLQSLYANYLQYILSSDWFVSLTSSMMQGISLPRLKVSDFKNIQIPLPSVEVQTKIVDEIKVLEDEAEYAREKIIELRQSIDEKMEKAIQEVPRVRLGEVCDIFNGGTPSTKISAYWNGGIPWATLVDVKQKYLTSTERTISSEGLKNSNATILPVNSVIFSSRATIGEVSIAKIETSTNQGFKNFVCNPKKIHYEYLYYVLKRYAKEIEGLGSGMTYKEISKEKISTFQIPLLPIEEQHTLVAEIEEMESEITRQREIIDALPNKRKTVLNRYF